MAGAKNHDYHILAPDIWPFVGALSALTFTTGMVFYMHNDVLSGWQVIMGLGIAGLIATFWGWFSKIVNEAQAGDHTPVVQLHMRYGMILFILSEVMFFVGWFWSWFDFALFPAPLQMVAENTWQNLIGQDGATAFAKFPADGIHVIDAFDLPLINTLILLCSGCAATWAHHALVHENNRQDMKRGLIIAIALGAIFTVFQAYEYSHAAFGFSGNIYGANFFMATGFHGAHVVIGTIFLFVCLIRVQKGHFTPQQHVGFEAAAWYWHFVDVVWLFLFAAVYIWGA